jgi:hypothetical protein
MKTTDLTRERRSKSVEARKKVPLYTLEAEAYRNGSAHLDAFLREIKQALYADKMYESVVHPDEAVRWFNRRGEAILRALKVGKQLIEDNRRGDIPLLIKEEDSFGDTGQSN